MDTNEKLKLLDLIENDSWERLNIALQNNTKGNNFLNRIIKVQIIRKELK